MAEDDRRFQRPVRIEQIQRLLQSREEVERLEGVERLLQMGRQDWMVPLLLQLLEDRSWLVRCAAAGGLAGLGDPQAIRPLRRHCRWWQEPSSEVRHAAGLALEQLLASGVARAITEVRRGPNEVGQPERSLAGCDPSASAVGGEGDLAESEPPGP